LEAAVEMKMVPLMNKNDSESSSEMNKKVELDRLKELARQLGVTIPVELDAAILVTSPSTGQILARISEDSPSNVNTKAEFAAVAAIAWNEIPLESRLVLVEELGKAVLTYRSTLIEALMIISGKPRPHCEGEIDEAAALADVVCGWALQHENEQGQAIVYNGDGSRIRHAHEATGVFAGPGAYNFPLLISGGFLHAFGIFASGGAYIAAPNPVNCLMSLFAEAIFEKAREATICSGVKVPAALYQIVQGREAAAALVEHSAINGIVFTGSSVVAKHVEDVARKRGIAFIGETGGHNPFILAPDLFLTENQEQLEKALQLLLTSFTASGGQICAAASRLFVPHSHLEKVESWLANAIKTVPVGPCYSSVNVVCAQMDERNIGKLKAILDNARADGSKVYGGDQLSIDGFEDGRYISPAFIIETKGQSDRILEVEPFGPVLHVIGYSSIEEALHEANRWGLEQDGAVIQTGLTAGICTLDKETELAFLRHVKAGVRYVWRQITGLPETGAFGPLGNGYRHGGRAAGTVATYRQYLGAPVTVMHGPSYLSTVGRMPENPKL
jgi:aldehyde dehydrogenase (NAD+)